MLIFISLLCFILPFKFFFPVSSEFFRCPSSCIGSCISIYSDIELWVDIQLSDSCFLLVSNMLRNRLLETIFDIRSFAFDHTQRNTIDEQHDVRSIGFIASRSENRKFLCYMIHIVFRMFPVDILEIETLFVSIDRLI